MSVNEKFSDEFYDSVVKNAEEENQVICSLPYWEDLYILVECTLAYVVHMSYRMCIDSIAGHIFERFGQNSISRKLQNSISKCQNSI